MNAIMLVDGPGLSETMHDAVGHLSAISRRINNGLLAGWGVLVVHARYSESSTSPVVSRQVFAVSSHGYRFVCFAL